MSILIKDMEMPTNCWHCRFRNGSFCHAKKRFLSEFDSHQELKENISDDCPIVPVPDYGRLIDANALKVDDGWLDNQDGTKTHIQFVYANSIIRAPTIIEAEEKKR